MSEREPQERAKHDFSPEESEYTKETIEEQAKNRLWRAAKLSELDEEMIYIEQGWAEKNDKIMLQALRTIDGVYGGFIESIFEDLANEDEERTIELYRDFVWENLHDQRYWRDSSWWRACQLKIMYENERQGFANPPPIPFERKQIYIHAEEGERFWKQVETEENAMDMYRKRIKLPRSED